MQQSLQKLRFWRILVWQLKKGKFLSFLNEGLAAENVFIQLIEMIIILINVRFEKQRF